VSSPLSRLHILSHGFDRFPAAQAVFDAAAKRFYDALSEVDKTAFQKISDPEEMVESIKQRIQQQNSQRTTRLLKICEKIALFGQLMKQYFKIVDTFVSSHPNWAAIVWGAVLLVFQVRLSISWICLL
jgi:hypothetical protein